VIPKSRAALREAALRATNQYSSAFRLFPRVTAPENDVKVLIVMPSLDPSWGGPQQSVRAWGGSGRAQSLELEVLTLDAPESPWLRDFAVPVYAIGAGVTHYRFNPALVGWLRANARNYDAVIVSGLWRFPSVGTWIGLRGTGVPYYVLAHGMLDPWFRRAYPLKHLKKVALWQLAERFVLRDARSVLFTTEEERLLARSSFSPYRASEMVLGHGVDEPPAKDPEALVELRERYPELCNRRVILSLGRIDKVKGLDLLIWAADHCPADVHFLMVGHQTAYGRELDRIARDRGVARRFTWAGPLYGPQKWAAFRIADVFILPSHTESFAVAAVEALACALPVLISNKVKMWRTVSSEQAGLICEDNRESTAKVLVTWFSLPAQERARMCISARRCYEVHFGLVPFLKRLGNVIGSDLADASAPMTNGSTR
jgi:glycosyltransferase involved in cell wall biosynthesis